MAAAIVIFIIAYAMIAIGRIPHVLTAVLGAMAMVFFGVMPGHEALEHINLEVILLLAGMMSLANVFARTGAFDWAAIRGAQLVRGDGFLTLCLMSVLTAVSSAFLDNVTVVVLAVPITISICRALDINPVPFFLAQVFASNIGGVSTVVADPPNIIIAAEADIGFVDFMANAAPVSLIQLARTPCALFGQQLIQFGLNLNPTLCVRRRSSRSVSDGLYPFGLELVEYTSDSGRAVSKM